MSKSGIDIDSLPSSIKKTLKSKKSKGDKNRKKEFKAVQDYIKLEEE